MSLKRNFWKGRRRKSVQVYIIHISKKKKLLSWSKKGVKFRVPSAKSFSPLVLPRREDLCCFVERDRKLGCWQRRRLERFLGRGERKEKEERDEGVAKRLEPNWNSNVTTARRQRSNRPEILWIRQLSRVPHRQRNRGQKFAIDVAIQCPRVQAFFQRPLSSLSPSLSYIVAKLPPLPTLPPLLPREEIHSVAFQRFRE